MNRVRPNRAGAPSPRLGFAHSDNLTEKFLGFRSDLSRTSSGHFWDTLRKQKHSAAFVVRKIGQKHATKSRVWLLVDKARDAMFTRVTSSKIKSDMRKEGRPVIKRGAYASREYRSGALARSTKAD
jgi:hypothetical protein